MTAAAYGLPHIRARRAERGRLAVAALTLAVAAIPVASAIHGRLAPLVDTASLHPSAAALWLRAGTVVACAVALAVHGALLRGPQRPVWALLPVDPAAVVREAVRDVRWRTAPWTVAAVLAMLPAAWTQGPAAFVAGAVGLAGVAWLAASSAAWALLGAVRAAEDPRWADLLDLVRGANPRPQAAILYAFAPVVLGVGLLAFAVSEAVDAAGPARAIVFAPWVVAAAIGPAVRAAAPAWWSATPGLEEVRARYAAVERPEEARRVALDGWAPRVPAAVRPWFLAELRHGWRARRGLVNAAWAVAAVSVWSVWTASPEGPGRAAAVAAAIALAPGAVPVLGAAHEAPWIRWWLADGAGRRAAARALAVVGWSAGPVAVAVAAAALRHGLDAGGTVAAGGGAGLAATALLTVGSAARRSLAGYVAWASLGAAGAVSLALGGPW